MLTNKFASSAFVKCMLAAIFGVSFTLSFAPANAWWFAPCCLAGLIMLLNDCRPRTGALLGFFFGLGWFGMGLWWVFTGLNSFTEAGPFVSIALTLALVMYLSIFPAGAALAIVWLTKHRMPHSNALDKYADHSSGLSVFSMVKQSADTGLAVLGIAAIWALSEWLRGNLFGGFPWLAAGYTQAVGPLAGFAPIIGVYGVCFVVALIAAVLAQCLGVASYALQIPRRAFKFFTISLVLIAMIAGVGHLLKSVEWTDSTAKTITVRLIQGNLPQHDKFSVDGLKKAVTTYVNLAAESSTDLTVLPETAFPIEWGAMPDNVKQAFQTIADDRDTTIVIGAVIGRSNEKERKEENKKSETTSARIDTNSAIAIQPGKPSDKIAYRYDKEHLLPLGEYFPVGMQWIAPLLSMNFGALTAGSPNQPPLAIRQGTLAVSICYEDMFDHAISLKAVNANAILNISNFAWFDHSYAPEQHLQVAQMRALETGRWFMRASNTGMTTVIDHQGIVRDVLPKNTLDALAAEVELRRGMTPFMRAGNTPTLLLSLCVVLLLVRSRSKSFEVVSRRYKKSDIKRAI